MNGHPYQSLSTSARLVGSIAALMLVAACQPHTETARRPSGEAAAASPRAAQSAEQEPNALDGAVFPDARQAFEALLAREKTAEVIGFGEYHQTKGSAAVPSSLQHFTDEILPALAGKATDLVFETWVASGTCGPQEKQVAEDVEQTTQRPSTTEAEIVATIKAAQSIGVQPHILEMSCDDYDRVFRDDEVDYDMMLKVLTRLLRDKVREVRYARAKQGGRWPAIVAVYGGNIHNDLYPSAETAAWSYGPDLASSLGERYIEVDLFVPEYIEGDEHLAQEPWYQTFLEKASPDHALLLERDRSSYVIVFKRSALPR